MVVLYDLISQLVTFEILLGKNGNRHILKVPIVGVPALKVRHVSCDTNEVSCLDHQKALRIHD